MLHYQTPGVYYEHVDAGRGRIPAIRIDVPGFVGIAERGPVDTPVPVQSWRQFRSQFGGFTGNAFLAYAVRAFFENGGRRCWVVRVANRDPVGGIQTASYTLCGPEGMPIWRICASSPGAWGNDISLTLTPCSRGEAIIPAGKGGAKGAIVTTTSGLERGSLLRLTQNTTCAWRVITAVDSVANHLFWTSDDPAWALPYDAPVSGFDPDRDILIQSLEYTLTLSYLGRPVEVHQRLSLIPESERYGPLVLRRPEYPTHLAAGRAIRSALSSVVIEELREAFREEIHPLRRWQLLQAQPLAGWVPIARNSAPQNSIAEWQPMEFGDSLREALSGGHDALARLSVDDFTGEDVLPGDGDAVRAGKARGFRALDAVAEVAALAVPDIHIRPKSVAPKATPVVCVPDPCLPMTEPLPAVPRIVEVSDAPPAFSEADIYRVQADMVDHCEQRRDRIALLDPPYSTAYDGKLGIAAIRAWRHRFDSKFVALYFPWLRVVDPLRGVTTLTRDIPPSGHVAGQYAASDLNVGPHKAPANKPLAWTQDVTQALDEEEHGVLNSLGINAIRTVPGRGIRILGARLLSSDPDWRYVNVRRLLLMIEKAIELSIQWAAFEPNDDATRNKIRLAILSFLIALWQQGALAGDRLEQALFVKCDGENNPPEERDLGRLWVHIGVAPAKPFEFIVLRVGRIANAFEIEIESELRLAGEP